MEEDGENPVSIMDVYEEFNNKVVSRLGMKEFKSRKVVKNYAFDLPNIPAQSEYLEVKYAVSIIDCFVINNIVTHNTNRRVSYLADIGESQNVFFFFAGLLYILLDVSLMWFDLKKRKINKLCLFFNPISKTNNKMYNIRQKCKFLTLLKIFKRYEICLFVLCCAGNNVIDDER